MPTTLPYTFSDGPGNTASGVQVTANDQALANAIDALIPSGTMMMTARSTAPAGFLLCDGAAVSRTTYAALFSAIGTVYGAGDGSTTFGLPDLRGRVPVGVDGAAARLDANDALGNSAGTQKHTLTTGEMPAHTHGEPGAIGFAAIRAGTSVAGAGAAFANYDIVTTTSATGGGGAHNIMQPYQVVNYLVKT